MADAEEETLTWTTVVKHRLRNPQLCRRNRDGVMVIQSHSKEIQVKRVTVDQYEAVQGREKKEYEAVQGKKKKEHEDVQAKGKRRRVPTKNNMVKYANNLTQLEGKHPSIIGFYYMDDEKKEVVLDSYAFSLQDKVMENDWSRFFVKRDLISTVAGFVSSRKVYFDFTPEFKKTLTIMIQGLAMLQAEGKHGYSNLSLDTVVFEEDDLNLEKPIFVDMFDLGPNRNPNGVWRRLGELINAIITHFKPDKTKKLYYVESSDKPKEMQRNFLPGERHPNLELFISQLMDDTRVEREKIIQHPAIIEDGRKRLHIEQMREKSLKILPLKPYFLIDVCQKRSWIDVAKENTYFKIMLEKNLERSQMEGLNVEKYKDTLQGCILMLRNTFVHLNDNLKAKERAGTHNVDLYYGTWVRDDGLNLLNDDEVAKMMEDTFPGLTGHLYDILTAEQWIVKF